MFIAAFGWKWSCSEVHVYQVTTHCHLQSRMNCCINCNTKMDASAYADESQSLEAEQHMALIWTEQNVNVFEFMWVNLCVVCVARLFFSLVFINWATAAACCCCCCYISINYQMCVSLVMFLALAIAFPLHERVSHSFTGEIYTLHAQ